MKTVPRYIANDGSEWKTKAEAKQADKKGAQYAALKTMMQGRWLAPTASGTDNDQIIEEVVDFLIENIGTLRAIIQK